MKEKPFAGLKTLVAMQLKEKLDFLAKYKSFIAAMA